MSRRSDESGPAAREEAKTGIAEAREKYRKATEEARKARDRGGRETAHRDFKEEVAKGREANNSVIELGMAGNLRMRRKSSEKWQSG